MEDKQNNDIWVFLSHSNEDYDKVRLVRNILEEQHFRPIMFFLKCLNDSDEVDSLIKREIDCRTRFILCDSENAQKSDWVQKEVAYIKEKQRTFQTIDISLSEEKIAKELMDFIAQATLFISYPREHWGFATELVGRLRKYDFFVFFDIYTVSVDASFEKQIKDGIEKAAQNGIFIPIVSRSTFDEWRGSNRELRMALERKSPIMPIFIEDNLPEGDLLTKLLSFGGVDVSATLSTNDALKYILTSTYAPGSLSAFAEDFATGRKREIDMREAELCRMIVEGNVSIQI